MTQQSEIAKATSDVLEVLAQKFGTTVEQVWGILVQRQIIYGWLDAGVGVVALIVVAVFARMARRGFAVSLDKCETRNDEDAAVARRVVGLACITLFSIVAAVNLYGGIVNILLPEAGALEYIKELVK